MTHDIAAMEFLRARGHKTVPQVYYGEDEVLVDGGFDGIKALGPDKLRDLMERKDAAREKSDSH